MVVNLKRPLGRVGKRKGTDPLPSLATRCLVGGDIFCALNDRETKVILRDEYWYGDGAPTWQGCWTAEFADDMRVAAIKRLRHRRFRNVPGALELADILEGCAAGNRCSSHGCPCCARAAQRWLAHAANRVLKAEDAGCKDWSFNFVMPAGQVAIGDLQDAPFPMILNKVRRALEKCRRVEFATLGIDVSANDDTEKFRRGKLTKGRRVYFQVHVYGVVRSRRRKAVWKALRDLFPKAANIYRPLHISAKPFDGAAKGVSYVCKPQGFRHIAYFDEGRSEWNTPIKAPALRPREYVNYLLAMHRLGLKNRVAFVGLHPEITKATRNRGRGVRLRRVVRGRSKM